MIIKNASSIPINQNCGTVVDVSGAMFDTFQPMVFTSLLKSVVGFQVIETPCTYCFQGNWQLLNARELNLKPEGQRAWKWYAVFAQPSLVLAPDQVITYLGEQYRVMASSDWSLNGYIKYELVQDYTGSGP